MPILKLKLPQWQQLETPLKMLPKRRTVPSIMIADTSPVEVEPHVVEEDEDDDDEEQEESKGFLILVALIWFVAIVTVILSLIKKPLIMVAGLVGVNVIFPVIFFLCWFGNKRKINYQMLEQDEGEVPQVQISMASV